jgi:hypothetical protein
MSSDGNLDVMVFLRCRSVRDTNNFVTQDASFIKERVVRGDQVLLKRWSTECVKLSLAAPGNLCREPVKS